MPTPAEAKQRASFTYNAAADFYDEAPLSFWDYFGQQTVEKLVLPTGARVLDACCGAGASALPAAERVGPSGMVLGVDLAERLLERARTKAEQRGLQNIQFRAADILALDEPDESFDAIICVFGIFFVPNMPEAVRELWRLLKVGGKLAITTWGPNAFEPANGAFWHEVQKLRPELHKAFNPWDRINDPAALRLMMREGGAQPQEAIAEDRRHPLRVPEDWWTIAMGSGYRGTIEQLTVTEREEIKRNNLTFLSREGVFSVETNAVYAIAVKPSRGKCSRS